MSVTLASLAIEEYRDELAAACARQRRPDCTVLPLRDGPPQYVTLHYSGVVSGDRRESIERTRVIAEAREHLTRNWGSVARPVYGDRYMYDFCVLSSGAILRTGGAHELWHCGNALGNARSWSVHVLLGPHQDLTDAQRQRLVLLFDALRAESGIARERVVAHCEWPRHSSRIPVPLPTYQPQPGQSSCPGRLLHGHLAAYRSIR